MRKLSLWLIGLALIVIATFAGPRIYREHSEAAVLSRAQAYWSAFVANDLLTAYELEAPQLTGLLLPHEVGITREWNQRMVSFELGSVTFYSDHAEVELIPEITLPDTQTGKTRKSGAIRDLWTFVDGDWYHGSPKERKSPIRKQGR